MVIPFLSSGINFIHTSLRSHKIRDTNSYQLPNINGRSGCFQSHTGAVAQRPPLPLPQPVLIPQRQRPTGTYNEIGDGAEPGLEVGGDCSGLWGPRVSVQSPQNLHVSLGAFRVLLYHSVHSFSPFVKERWCCSSSILKRTEFCAETSWMRSKNTNPRDWHLEDILILARVSARAGEGAF